MSCLPVALEPRHDPSCVCTFTTYARAGVGRLCREGAYRRGHSLRAVAVIAVALVAAVALAACGPGAVSTAVPSATSGAASFGPPPSANGSNTPITIDTTLLGVLPREVSSIPVIESPEGESDAIADPVLPTIATAAVAAVAVDTSTSDLVYVLVVRLKPTVFTADLYRDWRDSYDEGACLGVSNVVGHAERNIGSQHVFVGTCAGGLRTYHLWLEDKSILIAAASTGGHEFGILLLGNLRT